MRSRSILGDDNALEEIPGQHQGTLFLLHLGLIRNGVSRLDIVAFGAFVANKVNLQLFTDAVALFVGIILYDDAHIYIEAADFQLIEDDVFHAVGFFQLSEIQTGISQSHVGEVVFYQGVNVFFAFHIIADGTVDQEGITEIINILPDCIAADFLALDRP